jgi:hypothetical protein
VRRLTLICALALCACGGPPEEEPPVEFADVPVAERPVEGTGIFGNHLVILGTPEIRATASLFDDRTLVFDPEAPIGTKAFAAARNNNDGQFFLEAPPGPAILCVNRLDDRCVAVEIPEAGWVRANLYFSQLGRNWHLPTER